MSSQPPPSDDPHTRLGCLRVRIDEIDLQIMSCISERTRVVEEIGKVKREFALPIYEPKREDDVYRNVTTNNQGPLPNEAVRRIFERIIDEMRTVQRNRMVEQQSKSDGSQPGSK